MRNLVTNLLTLFLSVSWIQIRIRFDRHNFGGSRSVPYRRYPLQMQNFLPKSCNLLSKIMRIIYDTYYANKSQILISYFPKCVKLWEGLDSDPAPDLDQHQN
jgi:hypothetical protein